MHVGCHKQSINQLEYCIDHLFTNATELCSKSILIPTDCSNHNLVAIVRTTKVPKPGPRVIMKTSYRMLDQCRFIEEV